MRAIVVGRHNLTGEEGLDVIHQKDINFPATSRECKGIIYRLLHKAAKNNAVLVFQTLPGQVAVAVSKITSQRVGVIVNVPGERLSDQWQHLVCDTMNDARKLEKALKFANPRAKIERDNELVSVKVDPPLRFKFSHIEWF